MGNPWGRPAGACAYGRTRFWFSGYYRSAGLTPGAAAMNFLAHLYLAGPEAAAPTYAGHLLGQFIADSVPGRQLAGYQPEVQAGIRMHRAIDTFTDQHPVVRRSTARLRAAGAGKYAGVVADVFYDHFLAANFQEFSAESLPAFTQRV
ncbi:MAG: DUF479 domain-containing protein, partial [Hymenobacter sp.]